MPGFASGQVRQQCVLRSNEKRDELRDLSPGLKSPMPRFCRVSADEPAEERVSTKWTVKDMTLERAKQENKLARQRRATRKATCQRNKRLVASRNTVRVATLYKRKANKIRPVNSDTTDGKKPGGRDDWRERAWARVEAIAKAQPPGEFDEYLVPRTASFPRGQRLTVERAAKLIVGEDVLPEERRMLIDMLERREAALAWSFEEIGRVSEEVVPPQKIRTVPHEAWQAASFPIPRAIRRKVKAKILERLKAGVYERCEGPYRNPFFTVKKKNNDFRIVNAAMNINKVTIRDATLPPSADEFSERVAGMHVASLIDWFSGYDQITLAEESRDLTGFMTDVGLLRQTTLPQGATNSVAQFVRAGLRILEGCPAEPYMDDVAVDGEKTNHGNEEILPGIRRYILNHIVNLDQTLLNIELAGATVAGEKSQWLMSGLKVVGYVCDSDGRHPEMKKVEKVVNWPACQNVTEVKGFLGLCVYYRVWIKDFAIIAGPLYKLTRKSGRWEWTEVHDECMNDLKIGLTTAPALISIDYASGERIILVFDASPSGWGAVLMQERDHDGKKRRHPVRYESGLWTSAEAKYDQGKRECRALLKALKKLRSWLYGVHFYVETDANTLVGQLNRTATDLPGALVTQWIAWIRLFDFEIKHIPGVKNQAADALSRRRPTEEDIRQREEEVDIDEWVEAQLHALRIAPVRLGVQTEDSAEEAVRFQPGAEISKEESLASPGLLAEGYSEESQHIAAFLTGGMKKRTDLSPKAWRSFRRRALAYVVRGNHLFRRADRLYPTRRVIDAQEDRMRVLEALHDESGHKGRESTYRRVADRYFWEGMWIDVRKFVESCRECQLRSSLRIQEELTPTWVDERWEKIGVDIVHMPKDRGKSYLIAARSDFSGWVEARALTKADSASVAAFLYEEVICRHGIFRKVVLDGGPENQKLTRALLDKYGIRRVTVSSYHPEANGLVERGHGPIVDSLSKMIEGKNKWVLNLHTVLWADRTTVRASTGMTPYEVEYGQRPILPIELEIPTWSVMNWDEVRTQADLVAMRARVLQRREEDLEEAKLHLRRVREANKERFDSIKRTREERIEVGTLVLLHRHETDTDMSRSKKLSFRWAGPYRVKDCVQDRGTYLLEELDGVQLKGTFAGNRIRPFKIRLRESSESSLAGDEISLDVGVARQDEDSNSSTGSDESELSHKQETLVVQRREERTQNDRKSQSTRRLPPDFVINVPARQDLTRTSQHGVSRRRGQQRRCKKVLNVIDDEN